MATICDFGTARKAVRDGRPPSQPKREVLRSVTMTTTTNKVFTNWDDTHSALWGHAPIRMAHSMHESPLFQLDHLAELIERYPREHYSLMQTGVKNGQRIWRQGDIG